MEPIKKITASTVVEKMQIVKNHYIPGAKVKSYREIEKTAKEMINFIDKGIDEKNNKGNRNKDFALAHNQVEDKKPMAFFIVASEYKNQWPSQVIINPQIIEAKQNINIGTEKEPDMRSNIITYEEGCFSFPFRQPKKVNRFYRIKVHYEIPGKFWGLKTIVEELEGIKAHIFQHEYQHTLGDNIYFPKKEGAN